MSPSFSEATRLLHLTGTTARWAVPDGWQQGRGAFGGLVLGALLQAMARLEPDPTRAVRSLSGEITAPVLVSAGDRASDTTIQADVLRRGKGMTYLEARLTQGGEVKARASATLGAARPGPAPRISMPIAEAPPWTEVAVVEVQPPAAPVFTQHFEYRPLPPYAFSGAAEPRACGFVRPRVAPERLSSAYLVALADAWWPAIFATERAPMATATAAFTMQILCDPASLAGDVPLFHDAQVAAVSEGYFVEMRALWAGPQLVALNQQTFAVLG